MRTVDGGRTVSPLDKLLPGFGTHLSKQLELIFCFVGSQRGRRSIWDGGEIETDINQNTSVLNVLLLLHCLHQPLSRPLLANAYA